MGKRLLNQFEEVMACTYIYMHTHMYMHKQQPNCQKNHQRQRDLSSFMSDGGKVECRWKTLNCRNPQKVMGTLSVMMMFMVYFEPEKE